MLRAAGLRSPPRAVTEHGLWCCRWAEVWAGGLSPRRPRQDQGSALDRRQGGAAGVGAAAGGRPARLPEVPVGRGGGAGPARGALPPAADVAAAAGAPGAAGGAAARAPAAGRGARRAAGPAAPAGRAADGAGRVG